MLYAFKGILLSGYLYSSSLQGHAELHLRDLVLTETCEPKFFSASLDTSGNRFDKFPTQLFRCRNLVKLSLYNNLIRKIPGEFNCLTLLRHLDLG